MVVTRITRTATTTATENRSGGQPLRLGVPTHGHEGEEPSDGLSRRPVFVPGPVEIVRQIVGMAAGEAWGTLHCQACGFCHPLVHDSGPGDGCVGLNSSDLRSA